MKDKMDNSMLACIDKAHTKESKTKWITTPHLCPFEEQRTRKQPKLQ
jgi:hypothetical protein